MKRASFSALILSLVAAASAACGAGEGATTGDEQEVTGDESLDEIFGNDRVGARLRGKEADIPGDFAAFEKVFKVGRACAKSAKEIFVVQEAMSRETAQTGGPSKVILPRAVITGCALQPGADDPRKPSYSLMTALVSHDTGSTDNMGLQHLETMALDETTGEYNFYAFDHNGPGKPGSITRTRRDAKGNVTAKQWSPGGGVKTVAEPFNCFGCHVNGGPLMNEINDPWPNWVSPRSPLPKDLKMTGETLDIVRQADTASELEQIILSSTSFTVQGSSEATGFGPRTASGVNPGSVGSLLKSVFCETELAYKTAHTSLGVPLEVFVDPSTAPAFSLPAVDTSDLFPFQYPVRAAHDTEVEFFLQFQGYLTPSTVRAIRLLDDQNDIFSRTRCGAWKDATANLPAAPAEVDGAIRRALVKKVAAGAYAMSKEQKALATKLLEVADGDPSLAPLESAYAAELTARFRSATAGLATAEGRQALKAKEHARKEAARAMFEGGGPLPLLER